MDYSKLKNYVGVRNCKVYTADYPFKVKEGIFLFPTASGTYQTTSAGSIAIFACSCFDFHGQYLALSKQDFITMITKQTSTPSPHAYKKFVHIYYGRVYSSDNSYTTPDYRSLSGSTYHGFDFAYRNDAVVMTREEYLARRSQHAEPLIPMPYKKYIGIDCAQYPWQTDYTLPAIYTSDVPFQLNENGELLFPQPNGTYDRSTYTEGKPVMFVKRLALNIERSSVMPYDEFAKLKQQANKAKVQEILNKVEDIEKEAEDSFKIVRAEFNQAASAKTNVLAEVYDLKKKIRNLPENVTSESIDNMLKSVAIIEKYKELIPKKQK